MQRPSLLGCKKIVLRWKPSQTHVLHTSKEVQHICPFSSPDRIIFLAQPFLHIQWRKLQSYPRDCLVEKDWTSLLHLVQVHTAAQNLHQTFLVSPFFCMPLAPCCHGNPSKVTRGCFAECSDAMVLLFVSMKAIDGHCRGVLTKLDANIMGQFWMNEIDTPPCSSCHAAPHMCGN